MLEIRLAIAVAAVGQHKKNIPGHLVSGGCFSLRVRYMLTGDDKLLQERQQQQRTDGDGSTFGT